MAVFVQPTGAHNIDVNEVSAYSALQKRANGKETSRVESDRYQDYIFLALR